MSWMPRSGLDEEAGVVWLPRLLDKARRVAASGGGRLVDGYCYGRNDFIDKPVIAFLGTDDETIVQLVREQPSDAEVARTLVERSGRSAAECAAFSAGLKRRYLNFVLLEADEGRLPRGFKSAAIKFLYNRVLMPIVYAMFRRDEGKRASAHG